MVGQPIWVVRAERPFDGKVESFLQEVARVLRLEQQQGRPGVRCDVKTDFCEGRVTTKWEHAMIGAIGGVLFHARLDVGSESFTVDYIVRVDAFVFDDLKAGDGASTGSGQPTLDVTPFGDAQTRFIPRSEWN